MKKFIVLFAGLCSVPSFAFASVPVFTVAQLQALVSLLQYLGVDQNTASTVLREIVPQSVPVSQSVATVPRAVTVQSVAVSPVQVLPQVMGSVYTVSNTTIGGTDVMEAYFSLLLVGTGQLQSDQSVSFTCPDLMSSWNGWIGQSFSFPFPYWLTRGSVIPCQYQIMENGYTISSGEFNLNYYNDQAEIITPSK